jgi:uncharacterized protein (TIGR00369 family)
VPALAEVYFKPEGEYLVFGVDVAPVHCNGFAVAHGGFISTMADIWLGYNVAHLLPDGARFVTASLTVDFLCAVTSGDRLQSRMDRVKLGRRLHNATGVMLEGARTVAAMRASFAAC